VAVVRDPNGLQERVLPSSKNRAELVECLRVEDAFGYGIAEEIHELCFPNDQMDAIVAAIAILAKALRFPGVAVEGE
jgi:hypothetical protein